MLPGDSEGCNFGRGASIWARRGGREIMSHLPFLCVLGTLSMIWVYNSAQRCFGRMTAVIERERGYLYSQKRAKQIIKLVPAFLPLLLDLLLLPRLCRLRRCGRQWLSSSRLRLVIRPRRRILGNVFLHLALLGPFLLGITTPVLPCRGRSANWRRGVLGRPPETVVLTITIPEGLRQQLIPRHRDTEIKFLRTAAAAAATTTTHDRLTGHSLTPDINVALLCGGT